MHPSNTVEPPPVAPVGISVSVRRTLGSVLDYASVRWSLLRAEVVHARRSLIQLLILAILTLLSLCCAWVAASYALIVGVSRFFFAGDILPAVLTYVGISLVVSVGALALIWHRLSKRTFFNQFVQELKTDKQCLLHPHLT